MLWALQQEGLDITMVLQVVVDARTVGHKHQEVTQGLTQVVVVAVKILVWD